MDDPSLADLTGANDPYFQGRYKFADTESPWAVAYKKQLDETGVPLGPGGKSPQGYAYSWSPDDRVHAIGEATGGGHVKYGPSYDDPVFGRLQSTYNEPSKSKAARDRASMMAFAAAVSAISMGAGSALLAPAFSAATKYGMGGGIDPKSIALSLAMSQIPGVLGGIDPGLAQGYRTASQAYGIGKAGYDASRGNYAPAAGIGLNELTRTLG